MDYTLGMNHLTVISSHSQANLTFSQHLIYTAIDSIFCTKPQFFRTRSHIYFINKKRILVYSLSQIKGVYLSAIYNTGDKPEIKPLSLKGLASHSGDKAHGDR